MTSFRINCGSEQCGPTNGTVSNLLRLTVAIGDASQRSNLLSAVGCGGTLLRKARANGMLQQTDRLSSLRSVYVVNDFVQQLVHRFGSEVKERGILFAFR